MATCMAYGFDGFGISSGGIQNRIPFYRQRRKFGTILLRVREDESGMSIEFTLLVFNMFA